VYTQIRENLPVAGSEPAPRNRRLGFWVSSNVVFLGVTSLVTDISSEMVSSILPLYFVFSLQLNPLSFGAIDGLYHGVAALVRIGAGVAADRGRRPKQVAAAGYGLSAIAKLGLLAAGSAWTAVVGVIVVDRVGKGIRTAPRDALISLSAPVGHLGRAFGVHRALDTVGALLGPVLAFALLAIAANRFDVIFVVSFCIAIIGLLVLVLFVENRAAPGPATAAPDVRSAMALVTQGDFRSVMVAGGLLSLVTLSDGFVYLLIQRQMDISLGFFPLLYVGTAAAYLALAIPAGRLADRVGRPPVFLAGYVLLIAVYALLLLPTQGILTLVAALLLFGAFYAATDGVLMAIASTLAPAELRTTGLAVLTTVTSLGRLAASLLFGGLWMLFGHEAAIGLVLVALVAMLALIAPRLRTRPT
jgi:MFS family permease